MTLKEKIEIQKLLKELRESDSNKILQRASDFEIIQVLIQCAITMLQKKNSKEK